MTEKNISVLSFNIHYREAGSGSPVILLHGLGGDGSRWGPNIRPLAADFRVIVPDQIGFGQSDKPLANYHSGMLAEFLARFMKAIDVPKASVVGSSMGASVAIYFAVHYPHLLDRLVMVDGGSYRSASASSPMIAKDPHVRQIQNGVMFEETREFFEIMFHDKSMLSDKVIEDSLIMRLRSGYTIGKMQEAFEKGLGSVTEEEACSIKAPTLIIWGKYDRLVDPDTADRLNATIPGSRKVIIDNAGHLPQLERYSEFNRIVRDFLSSSSRDFPADSRD
jgi:pimeloyl-ACP methyl ester carboxylesterase